MITKVLDWKKTEEQARKMSSTELLFAIKDCRKASLAMRGWNPSLEGYYHDEASVYLNELKSRRRLWLS